MHILHQKTIIKQIVIIYGAELPEDLNLLNMCLLHAMIWSAISKERIKYPYFSERKIVTEGSFKTAHTLNVTRLKAAR